MPHQDLVDEYLPPYSPPHRIDPERPESWGNVVTQEMFNRHRRDLAQAMARVPEVALEADREWGRLTGRSWGVLERYRCDGARTVVVTMGSMCGTARDAVDAMRDAGQAVGLLKLRLFRPLPVEALRAALAGVARGDRARPQLLARPRRRAAPGIARCAVRHARGAAHPRPAGRGGRGERVAAAHRRAGGRAGARTMRRAESVWVG